MKSDVKVQGIMLRADWLSFLDVKPNTALSYYKAVKKFNDWRLAHEIDRPTEKDIRVYKAELAEKLSPATVQLYMVGLRQFFEYLSKRGLYENVALNVKGLKSSSEHKRDALTVEQARRVLGALDTSTVKGKRDKAMIALMLTTGLRSIELFRADVSDVELWQGEWFMRVQGDEKAERVRLPLATKQLLDEYVNARGNLDGALFQSLSNKNRGARLQTQTISRTVKAIFRAAGINSPRLTCHSCRHTFATTALKNGLDIASVADSLLGGAQNEECPKRGAYERLLKNAPNGALMKGCDCIMSENSKAVKHERAALDAAKTRLYDYLADIGHAPGKNDMLQCICRNHNDSTPSMKFNSDDNTVHCFGCNFHGDLVDVIAEVEGLPAKSKDAIDRAIEFAGTAPRKATVNNATKNNAHWLPALSSQPCVDYLHQRGFAGDDDKQIIETYRLAFDPKLNCLIIPHDGDSFTARAIGDVAKEDRYKHNPRKKVELFNGSAIASEPVIAVCEGAIDALSLIACGCPAVATGGAQTQTKFLNALKKIERPPHIIVAFDNDQAGNDAAHKLVNKLHASCRVPFVRLDLCGAPDVNDLFCTDRGKLTDAISKAKDALARFNADALDVLPPDEIAKQMLVNKFGYPLKNTSNFDLIFKHDPVAKGLVAFNQMSSRIELARKPPWRQSFAPNTPWQDCDDCALQNYIDRTYELSCNTVFLRVFNEYAHHNSFHPVQDFFNALPAWDGQHRAESLLIDNLGADDTPYVRAATKHWLLAAVARIFNPGCKFDYCLVLKGKQGIGKSTLLQRLGGAWFGELNSIQGKDAVGDLQGLWIVELVEMQATKRADNEQIKSFLSACKDRARLSYDRRTSEFPRQCVFAATTNEHEFLRDQTGGRRFWIVDLHSEHYSLCAELDTQQVWAEVLHLYRQLFNDGFDSARLDLPNELKPVAVALQAENTDGSDLRGRITAFLDRPIPRHELWQLLSQEERRRYFKEGKVGLALARVDQHWKDHDSILLRTVLFHDDDGDEFLALTPDLSDDKVRSYIFGDDPRRQTISPVELANELFYDDKIAVNNRRISDILRTLDGWQQSKVQRRDHAYGKQKTIFERVNAD